MGRIVGAGGVIDKQGEGAAVPQDVWGNEITEQSAGEVDTQVDTQVDAVALPTTQATTDAADPRPLAALKLEFMQDNKLRVSGQGITSNTQVIDLLTRAIVTLHTGELAKQRAEHDRVTSAYETALGQMKSGKAPVIASMQDLVALKARAVNSGG